MVEKTQNGENGGKVLNGGNLLNGGKFKNGTIFPESWKNHKMMKMAETYYSVEIY
jgi:hypothetical protein